MQYLNYERRSQYLYLTTKFSIRLNVYFFLCMCGKIQYLRYRESIPNIIPKLEFGAYTQ